MRIIRLKIVRFSRRSIDFVKRNLKAEVLKENNLWRYAIRCDNTFDLPLHQNFAECFDRNRR